MATRSLTQPMIATRRTLVLALTLATLAALLLAARIMASTSSHTALPAQSQPVIGRSLVVTGSVFDGTRYVQAPIALGAHLEQPVVGLGVVVTAPVFDGQAYRTMAVHVAGTRADSYTVTAPVFDGRVYRSAPVQVGGY